MISQPILTWLRFIVWLIIGFGVYFLYSMRHSRVKEQPNETGDKAATKTS